MLLILAVCCNNYYGDIINKLPFGIHEWAQADRYALAINFYDNGLDFFHPATQNLGSVRGIVGVEFPIQAYLAALIAHITGRGSISLVFRLLDILIAATGLYFLFRAVYNATRDFIFSITAPLFVFCSPVFIFYAGNYLPDPAAAAITFIAFYYLLEAMRLNKQGTLMTAIAFATLATLIKTSAGIYLGGIIFYGLYDALISRKNRRSACYILAAACISALLIVANMANIHHLNQKYQSSLFLKLLHAL